MFRRAKYKMMWSRYNGHHRQLLTRNRRPTSNAAAH